MTINSKTTKRYAALDFGTYSTLLLVAREDATRELVEETELFRVTRLGADTAQTGRLTPDGIARTIAAARGFLDIVRAGTADIAGVAAATSAVRDAANRDVFLQECRDLLGAPPLLLSGNDEAVTAFLGAASDQDPAARIVHIDIGGGSTELSAGQRDECLQSHSLNIGSARLAERFDLFETVPRAQQERARQAVRKAVAAAITDLEDRIAGRRPPQIVASGGTATTYASMQLGLTEYRREAVHGFVSTERKTAEACDNLFDMSVAERRKIPGIEPGRAPVLPAGLVILGEILHGLGSSAFTVTTRGLRFGLVRQLQRGDIAPTWQLR